MLKETINSNEYKKIEEIKTIISEYPIKRDRSDVKVLMYLVELEEAVGAFKNFIKGSTEILKSENPAELAKYILELRLFALATAANSGPIREDTSKLSSRMEDMRKMGELLIETIDQNPGAIDLETILKSEEEEKNLAMKVQKIRTGVAPTKRPSMFGKSLGFESED